MKNKKLFFGFTFVALLAFFMTGSYIYKANNLTESALDSHLEAKLVRPHSPTFGPKDAPVTLVEFLDPECESCRKFYNPIKSLLKKYSTKVKLVIRYAPFHQNSRIAIRALEAARLQGQYWQALEVLFQYQPQWGDHHNPKPELIFEYLKTLKLDMKKLEADMYSEDIKKIIAYDRMDLQEFQVNATPTFFVNGKKVKLFGIDYVEQSIQRELMNLNAL
ncbi:MAG: DsbA family protein [Bacteriovoracaceae bacterium]